MHRIRFRLRPAAAAIGLAALLLPSCSTAGAFKPLPETGATLGGTVRFKNEPLRIGTVIVQGAHEGAQGKIHEDGHFTVGNVPLGEVTIAVTMGPAHGEVIGLAAAQKARGEHVSVPKIVNIPAKYSDASSSPLKTTIQKGENNYDIILN
jgi:hypothetical protein